MTLFVLTPSRRIAEAALRIDHGIDPRNPAIRFAFSDRELRGLAFGTPVWLLDPLCQIGRETAAVYRHLKQIGRVRDWTEAEKASVREARR